MVNGHGRPCRAACGRPISSERQEDLEPRLLLACISPPHSETLGFQEQHLITQLRPQSQRESQPIEAEISPRPWLPRRDGQKPPSPLILSSEWLGCRCQEHSKFNHFLKIPSVMPCIQTFFFQVLEILWKCATPAPTPGGGIGSHVPPGPARPPSQRPHTGDAPMPGRTLTVTPPPLESPPAVQVPAARGGSVAPRSWQG